MLTVCALQMIVLLLLLLPLVNMIPREVQQLKENGVEYGYQSVQSFPSVL